MATQAPTVLRDRFRAIAKDNHRSMAAELLKLIEDHVEAHEREEQKAQAA
jgi:hypothetical protein